MRRIAERRHAQHGEAVCRRREGFAAHAQPSEVARRRPPPSAKVGSPSGPDEFRRRPRVPPPPAPLRTERARCRRARPRSSSTPSLGAPTRAWLDPASTEKLTGPTSTRGRPAPGDEPRGVNHPLRRPSRAQFLHAHDGERAEDVREQRDDRARQHREVDADGCERRAEREERAGDGEDGDPGGESTRSSGPSRVSPGGRGRAGGRGIRRLASARRAWPSRRARSHGEREAERDGSERRLQRVERGDAAVGRQNRDDADERAAARDEHREDDGEPEHARGEVLDAPNPCAESSARTPSSSSRRNARVNAANATSTPTPNASALDARSGTPATASAVARRDMTTESPPKPTTHAPPSTRPSTAVASRRARKNPSATRLPPRDARLTMGPTCATNGRSNPAGKLAGASATAARQNGGLRSAWRGRVE